MSVGRPGPDGLVHRFNGTGFGEGGLERPTLQLGGAVQIIAIPHTRTVTVVDLGPAEQKLDELRKRAALMGVDNYGAAVVERLCTPFTSGDPSVEFATEIEQWIAQRGGDQR